MPTCYYRVTSLNWEAFDKKDCHGTIADCPSLANALMVVEGLFNIRPGSNLEYSITRISNETEDTNV